VDNLSFFSFEGGEDVLGSLPSEAQRRLSAGSRGTSLETGERQEGKRRDQQGPGGRVYLGYLLVLTVAALHAASTFVSTLIPTSCDPWLLLLGRALLQLLVSIVLLIVTRRNPLGPRGFRWRLYLVGLLSAALLLATHLAFTRLPAADACALLGLAPVVTAGLALPLAGERLGLLRIVTCALFFAGLLLHTRPPMLFPEALVDATNVTQYNILGLATTFPSPPASTVTDVVGLVAGIAASLLAAFLLLLAKQCREAVTTAQLLHWVALGLTLISSVGLITQVSADLPTLLTQLSTSDWLLGSLVAALGSLATLLLLLALAWVAAGRAALVASASILFNYTVQLAVGTGLPAWPGLLGAAMLLLSLLFAGLEALLVHPRRWRWL
jgi:drug/metabolite transporter (DMT)-like permease